MLDKLFSSGIGMMLQSMGINHDEAKVALNSFAQMIVEMKQSIDRIEAKIDALSMEKSGRKDDVREFAAPKRIDC